MGVTEDFTSSGFVRYTHRTMDYGDIYFVANRTDKQVKANGVFRIAGRQPELWDPITGTVNVLPEYTADDRQTTVPLQFEPFRSYFVVFRNQKVSANETNLQPAGKDKNFPEQNTVMTLNQPWQVSFDPQWGGPESVTFEQLTDWTSHADSGIRYYSGTAVYKQTFDLPEAGKKKTLWLDLGKVKNVARVRLNGKNLGVVWTTPWKVDISKAVKSKNNKLEIEVINLWTNRLIGDEQLPDDGIRGGKWPEWLINGTKRPSNRYTFTTHKHYKKDSPLLESGLLGPVTLSVIK
jgi:hypothetical protein